MRNKDETEDNIDLLLSIFDGLNNLYEKLNRLHYEIQRINMEQIIGETIQQRISKQGEKNEN